LGGDAAFTEAEMEAKERIIVYGYCFVLPAEFFLKNQLVVFLEHAYL